MEARAFEHGKELMDAIRSRHTIVASNIERFVMEIGTKFIARPEERLLNVVHSLLQRCYRLPLPQGADVPDYMKRELKTVCDACLSPEMHTSWKRRGMLADVRESFVGDVRPQSTTTLKQLMTSLKVGAAPARAPSTRTALALASVKGTVIHQHSSLHLATSASLLPASNERKGGVTQRVCSAGSRSCWRSARPSFRR